MNNRKAKNRAAAKKLADLREMYPVGTLIKYAGSYAIVSTLPVFTPYNEFTMEIRFIIGGYCRDTLTRIYIGHDLPEIATIDDEFKDRKAKLISDLINLEANIDNAKMDIDIWENQIAITNTAIENIKKIDIDELKKQL